MHTTSEAKAQAKALRTALAEHGTEITHSAALDLVARQHGVANWSALAARLADAPTPLAFTATSPVFRIFDEPKAMEFYVDFLGFTKNWEHRHEPGLPIYCQVSRAGLLIHLSGHFGDGSPAASAFVETRGLRAFQRELIDKRYSNMRPGLEQAPWGLVMQVTDPFGNRINFRERE